MLHLDFWRAFNSIDQKAIPEFNIYVNGKEFIMPLTVAEMMSRKIRKILAEDEVINMFSINLDKEIMCTMCSLSDSDFKTILWKSFEKFHKLFRGEGSNLTLREIECMGKFMDVLETEYVSIDTTKYDEITIENSLEIMNSIRGVDTVRF